MKDEEAALQNPPDLSKGPQLVSAMTGGGGVKQNVDFHGQGEGEAKSWLICADIFGSFIFVPSDFKYGRHNKQRKCLLYCYC